MDGESNDARTGISGTGEPVQIDGSFTHTPVPGGSATFIRRMQIGGTPHQAERALPDGAPQQEAERRSGRFLSGYAPGLPGPRCTCGFSAFAWQQICPKCGGNLKGT